MKLREMAASIAIFVHKDQVKISGNSVSLEGYTLNEMSEKGWLVGGANVPMCSGELFTSQLAPGYCTGFLVHEDILMTAGHCLEKVSCSDMRIVFEFQMESDNSLATLSKNNVFKCKEVIAQELPHQQNQYLDYAIVKLDRPPDRLPLSYGTEDLLEAQDRVAVIGYPSGLPLKIASDALVLSNEASNAFFVANLDTFGSNSGSPVIDVDTYQVEGILVRGMPDYVLSEDGSCVRVNRCPEDGDTNCAGENATKMATLADQISESTNTSSDELNCFPGVLTLIGIVLLVRLKIT
jgi:V8-like Glu-specific endopeptidase